MPRAVNHSVLSVLKDGGYDYPTVEQFLAYAAKNVWRKPVKGQKRPRPIDLYYVPRSLIVPDEDQVRSGLVLSVVAEITDQLMSGQEIKVPLEVYLVQSADRWYFKIESGHHRFEAYRSAVEELDLEDFGLPIRLVAAPVNDTERLSRQYNGNIAQTSLAYVDIARLIFRMRKTCDVKEIRNRLRLTERSINEYDWFAGIVQNAELANAFFRTNWGLAHARVVQTALSQRDEDACRLIERRVVELAGTGCSADTLRDELEETIMLHSVAKSARPGKRLKSRSSGKMGAPISVTVETESGTRIKVSVQTPALAIVSKADVRKAVKDAGPKLAALPRFKD